MGFRAGKARGPWVGPNTGGSTPSSPDSTPTWFLIGEFTYENFAVANPSTDIEAYSLPNRGVVGGIFLKTSEEFGGGGIASYDVNCFVPGFPDFYFPAFNVMLMGSQIFQQTSIMDMQNFDAATSIRIGAVSTGANLSAATSGAFQFWLNIAILPLT